MTDLLSLDPSNGVPDLLYEILHWEPATEAETCAGHVLRLHRDFLNGGMQQALMNLSAIGEDAQPYVAAYSRMGLDSGFALWNEAIDAIELANGSDEYWNSLDERYERLVYGEHRNESDAVERSVLAAVQRSPAAFSNALSKAGFA